MWSVGLCLCICFAFLGGKTETNIHGSPSKDISVLKNVTRVVNLSETISDEGYFNGTIPNSLTCLRKQHDGSSNNNNNTVFYSYAGNFPGHINHVHKPKDKTRRQAYFFVRLTKTVFLLIVVSVSLLILVGFAIILTLCYLLRRKNRDTVLFKGFNEMLDLKFLVEAPREVLGLGTFGTTFRVTLEDGTFVVLKILKGGWMRKTGFEAQMEIVRGIKHENLVDLRAYYCSETQTYLAYDYFEESSSVSHLLYGDNSQDRIRLDWQTRMMIAIGAAKGIARIHKENKGTMVHGNIKSSNIFINSKGQGCVSEFGLAAAMSPMTQPIASETGYRAPELFDTSVATQMADIYSFGIVLLELLTGKAAVLSISTTEKQGLAQWVHSELDKEWTVDLLDPCRQRSLATEPIMHALLKYALACVQQQPHQRPKIDDIVALMEELTQS